MCYNPPMLEPYLSIIMVSYNTCAILRQSLHALLASRTDFSFEVWVVDNASADGSAEMVAQDFGADVRLHLIRSPRNGGYAAGNNLALAALNRRSSASPAGADGASFAPAHLDVPFVLLLNPDTIVPATALQQMVEFMQEHPDVAIVGPKMVRPDGRLDLACRRGFPTPLNSFYKLTGLAGIFKKSKRFAGYNVTYADPDSLTEVDSVMGAFMMLRSAAINQIGFLDEAYFMYGEDLDWAYRIKQRGWRVFYNPAVKVIHYKGESSRQRSYAMILQFYRSMRIFYRKHYAARTFFALNWLVQAGITTRGAIAIAQNFFRPAERKRVT
jgi:N-acetylglucosaminyl-diphospho-decaprenol L-rhamnosyltransferase